MGTKTFKELRVEMRSGFVRGVVLDGVQLSMTLSVSTTTRNCGTSFRIETHAEPKVDLGQTYNKPSPDRRPYWLIEGCVETVIVNGEKQ